MIISSLIWHNIKQLIPQRDPILMVDELLGVEGEQALTSFTVRSENIFLNEEDRLEESGVIEHIAQSASAFMGYKSIMAGTPEPPLWFLGEVKNFHSYHRPQIGERLLTTITLELEMDGGILLMGQTHVGDELMAESQMKIFIKA